VVITILTEKVLMLMFLLSRIFPLVKWWQNFWGSA